MKLFFLLLTTIVFLLTKNNALRCMHYDGILLILPVSTFNLAEIKETVNKQVTYQETQTCYIYMMYDTSLQTFTLAFRRIDDFVTLTVNTNIFTMTAIILDENAMITNQTSFQNMVMFSCDKEDTCNEKFMYDYLEWVYRMKDNSLVAVVRPLLVIENGHKGQCIVSNTNNVNTCASGICGMAVNFETNETERRCENMFQGKIRFIVGMKIILHRNDEQGGKKLKLTESLTMIGYTCNSNNCNNNQTDKLVQQVIKDQFNLSSLHVILEEKFNLEYLPESTTLSTIISTSTTNMGGHLNTSMTNKQPHNFSMSIIVLASSAVLTFLIHFF